MASLGQARAPCSNDNIGDPFKTSGARASSARPSLTKTFSSRYCYTWLVVLFASKCCPPISAQGNFSVQKFNCNSSLNVMCLGSAHAINEGPQVGSLSLLTNANDSSLTSDAAGVAYYNEPVRLLDPFTRQSASFNTSFAVDQFNRTNDPGDGFTFVISADSKTLGGYGKDLGIFNAYTNRTSNGSEGNFKSIVVEFDTFYNYGSPTHDISDNHVSFDFVNIGWAAAANASNANVTLGDPGTLYAWVEYSNQTQQLEARISNYNSRPMSPLLNYRVNLSDVVEQYMWVGFSAGSGTYANDYFVKNWTFESHGLLPLDLEFSPSPVPSGVPSRSSKLGLILGISVGALVFLLACISIVVIVDYRRSGKCCFKRYCQLLRWTRPVIEDPSPILEGMPERFSFKQLSVATRNFSKDSKLGQGGFGTVYRGVLPSGIPMAVKKISGNSTQGEKQFMAEVIIISQLRHRNLIQLLGWCKDASKGNYLLVYELMPNGSLDKALFGPAEKRTACLSWPQRFNIVMGAASALDYLHQGWTQQVIHRDIKSSNIMLDEKWNAKLGDFGLARLIDHERTPATTLVAGTYGYIAPEVVVSGKFTDKSDNYAFGVVVLEITCGRKAFASYLPEDEMLLVNWVWQKLSEGDLLSTVDKLLESYDTFCMELMLKVGLLCCHPNPLARPTMKHVVQILSGDAPLPFIPASKPVLVFSSDPEGVTIEKVD